MRTTDEIMAQMPATNANAATPPDVLSGKVYWGLKTGEWGVQTGAMPAQTLPATTSAVPAGYYAAPNLTQVDADLAAGNIKTGVEIFGIADTLNANIAALMLIGQQVYRPAAHVYKDPARRLLTRIMGPAGSVPSWRVEIFAGTGGS